MRTTGETELAFGYDDDRTLVEDAASGERRIFERRPDGVVVAFESTTGVAWRLSLDGRARVSTLALSETAARLADLQVHRFRPDGVALADLGRPWARTIRFGHSAAGVAFTETVSGAGAERRVYEYDEPGRLTAAWSSTGGLPALRVVYLGSTVVLTDPAGRIEMEFDVDRHGRATMFSNGHVRVDIQRDNRGAVVAFRAATDATTSSVSFGRDRLGRLVRTSHADGSADRYFLDDLGHRVRTEYGGGGWLRVDVDPMGDIVEVEGVDGEGHRLRPPRHDGGGTNRETRGALPAADPPSGIGDLGTAWLRRASLDRLDPLRKLVADEPERVRPYYGALRLDPRFFVPVVDDPVDWGVAGLRDALTFAVVAAGLLHGTNNTLREAFDSPTSPAFLPSEYRARNSAAQVAGPGQPPVVMSGDVIVVGNKIPVVGYFSMACREPSLDFESTNEACGWPTVSAYTQPKAGDLRCTRCPTGGGGGGGGAVGGGDGDEEDEEDEEDEDCDPPEGGGPSASVSSYAYVERRGQPIWAWGYMRPMSLDVDIDAVYNANADVWEPAIIKADSTYEIWWANRVQEAHPSRATAQNCTQMISDLDSLNQIHGLDRWYMEDAVKAHEYVHVDEWKSSQDAQFTTMKNAIGALSVPHACGKTRSTAVAELKALTSYNTAIRTAFNAARVAARGFGHWSPATIAAERAVVDPMIERIRDKGDANAASWPAYCQHSP